MAVITISRDMATGGKELGRLLARRLDYQYVDKSLFQDIAEDLNISKGTLISFEETRRYEGYVNSVVRDEDYKKSLEYLLLELARKDNVVIIGRAAYCFLKDMKNCYHIRLVAPMDWRKKYAMENYKIHPDRVQGFIEKRDRNLHWFRRSICGAGFDDPILFHLTLNMSRIQIEKAVELIISVANLSG